MIATGTSRRQIHTLAEETDAALRAEGDARMGIEGYEASKWVVQDYGDIVVHVFDPDTRDYYKLEELWADAPEGGLGAGTANDQPLRDPLPSAIAITNPSAGPRLDSGRRPRPTCVFGSTSRAACGRRRPAVAARCGTLMNLLTHIRSLFEPVLTETRRRTRRRCRTTSAMIKPAANPEHGDYQANFAMALAKVLGQEAAGRGAGDRRQAARERRARTAEVAGPGFINLRLKPDWLAKAGPADRDRRPARRRSRPRSRAPSSSTISARTSPSRCTSATCAARSSATP